MRSSVGYQRRSGRARNLFYFAPFLPANFVFGPEKYADVASRIRVGEPKTNGADDET